MRDYRLLLSAAATLAVPILFFVPWPRQAAAWRLLDETGGALLIGLVVGRLTSVAIDDPRSLTSLSDLLIIRSGVEFWPAVAAACGSLWLSARRRHQNPWSLLALVASAGMMAWATYEATCLVRDGCPGPVTAFGLRPRGLSRRQFPVGLVVAAAGVAAARVLERARRTGLSDVDAVLVALLSIASIRAVASVWLPTVGDSLSRQHVTSITVVGLSSLALIGHRMIVRRRRLT